MKVRRLTEAKKLNELKRMLLWPQDLPAISADDATLFRESMGQVRQFNAPLPAIEPPKIAPDAAMRRLDDAMVMDELLDPPIDAALLDGADQMSYLADGYSPKLLRKLRAGQFRVSDELDLHHLTHAIAKRLMHRYLHDARQAGQRCLRLIHGKGLRSGNDGPVLKQMVDLELRRRKDVIAFVSAKPEHGGTGAVLVLLANG